MSTTLTTPETTTPARTLFFWTYVGWGVQTVIAVMSWVLYLVWTDPMALTGAIIWTLAATGGVTCHYLGVWQANRSYRKLRAEYDREV